MTRWPPRLRWQMSENRRKTLVERLRKVADEEEASGAAEIAADFRAQARMLEQRLDHPATQPKRHRRIALKKIRACGP